MLKDQYGSSIRKENNICKNPCSSATKSNSINKGSENQSHKRFERHFIKSTGRKIVVCTFSLKLYIFLLPTLPQNKVYYSSMVHKI